MPDTDSKVLVFGPSGIGDWVVIASILPDLLAESGCTQVVAVVPRRNPGTVFLERFHHIAEVVYLERPSKWRKLPSYALRLLWLIARLRQRHFVATYTSYLSNAPDVLTLIFLSGIPRRVGQYTKRSRLERFAFTTQQPFDPTASRLDNHLALLGSRDINPRASDIGIDISPLPDISQLRSQFDLPNRYVVLAIGGGYLSRWKFWPAKHWAHLIELHPETRFLLVGGGTDDADLALQIMKAAPPNTKNLVGRVSFEESIQILRNANACVGIDNGLSLMARVFDIPSITIYGPTNPAIHGAALFGSIPFSVKVPCGPCFVDTEGYPPHVASTCTHYTCLWAIDPSRISNTLRRLLIHPTPLQ